MCLEARLQHGLGPAAAGPQGRLALCCAGSSRLDPAGPAGPAHRTESRAPGESGTKGDGEVLRDKKETITLSAGSHLPAGCQVAEKAALPPLSKVLCLRQLKNS